MRRRLLASTLAAVIAAVVLLGVPLGYFAGKLLKSQERDRDQRAAQAVAAAIEDKLDSGSAALAQTLKRVAPADRRTTVTLPRAQTLSVGPAVGRDAISASTPIERGGHITVASGDDDVDRRMATGWLLIAVLGAAAIGAGVGMALLQARRLAGPLVDLSRVAERLGSGDARSAHRRYGVPELDRVADVLEGSATRLSRLLGAEREFATDASHQLRTPLTALSIRLEEIVAASDQREVREEAMAALVQAERLSAVVDQLLRRARDSRSQTAVPFPVADVVAQQADEWRPAFRREQREISVEAGPAMLAVASPGGLAQVLATLLDNSLTHGGGQVDIRCRREEAFVVIEVADHGNGIAPELVPRIFERAVSGAESTGLGLALARAIVEADGGRLELVRARPAVFAVFLPAAADGRRSEPAPRPVSAGRG
ncbi:MAG: sensor histidine kinase [Actinomycetes bacterium]